MSVSAGDEQPNMWTELMSLMGQLSDPEPNPFDEGISSSVELTDDGAYVTPRILQVV